MVGSGKEWRFKMNHPGEPLAYNSQGLNSQAERFVPFMALACLQAELRERRGMGWGGAVPRPLGQSRARQH